MKDIANSSSIKELEDKLKVLKNLAELEPYKSMSSLKNAIIITEKNDQL